MTGHVPSEPCACWHESGAVQNRWRGIAPAGRSTTPPGSEAVPCATPVQTTPEKYATVPIGSWLPAGAARLVCPPRLRTSGNLWLNLVQLKQQQVHVHSDQCHRLARRLAYNQCQCSVCP